jgi:hypothetical protein
VDCDEPLDIRARVPKDGPNELSRYLRAAIRAVVENLSPDGSQTRTLSAYAVAVSKGIGEPEPIDSISFSGAEGYVDVSTVFAGFAPRMYQLDWCGVAPTGKAECPGLPRPQLANLSSDGKLLVEAPREGSGLYQLFSCDLVDGVAIRASSAFVLIAPDGATASRLRSDYNRFSQLINGWSSFERSMLLRAYMQHLKTTMRG